MRIGRRHDPTSTLPVDVPIRVRIIVNQTTFGNNPNDPNTPMPSMPAANGKNPGGLPMSWSNPNDLERVTALFFSTPVVLGS